MGVGATPDIAPYQYIQSFPGLRDSRVARVAAEWERLRHPKTESKLEQD